MADIDKFTYLRSFLSNSALQSINGLSLNATNYKEAIEILHERYRNKQVLTNAYMEKLDKLPSVTPSNNFNGLRKMYVQIEVCVRNLKTLNIDIATYGASHILVPFLNQSDFISKLSKLYLATGWYAKNFKKRSWVNGKILLDLNWKNVMETIRR